MGARKEIPALTGLRFVAAFIVLVAHVALGLPNNLATRLLVGLAQPGMVLFFVLSGFVMWLNYAQPIVDGQAGAVRDFAIARFARLYPMYLIVILADLGAILAFDGWSHVTLILPETFYFLAGIESWIPDYDGHLIVRAVPNIAHLWSISVETFFYLAFPLIALLISRLHKRKTIALSGLINLVISGTIFYFVNLYYDKITPMIASRLTHPEGLGWLIYFSPYLRVFEFSAGCIACHQYLTMRNQKPANWECSGALPLGYMAAVSILVVTGISELSLTTKHSATCAMLVEVIPLLAFPFLIFFLVRYRSTLHDILSCRPVVAGGEISYSLYLLHPLVITGAYWLTSYLQVFGKNRSFWFVVITILVSFLGSIFTYLHVEIPAKRWIRGAGRRGTSRDLRPLVTASRTVQQVIPQRAY